MQVRHATSANAEVERAFYSYDSLGNPLTKDTATGRYTYSYDAANQLTSEWNQAGRTTWTYDAAYRRATQRTLGSLASTTYTFDAADELTSYVTIASRTTFSYDANGQTTKVHPPTGNPTSYSWDGGQSDDRALGCRLVSGGQGERQHWRDRRFNLPLACTRNS